MTVSTVSPASRSGGLLVNAFNAGALEEIHWVDVTVGDLIVTVASDALKAKVNDREHVRLPVSYKETVSLCRSLGCVPPTKAIADAMFAQAKVQCNFVGLVRTAADSARMATVEFTFRFNDGVQKQLPADLPPGSLLAGAWKYWILHPRMVTRGACNYGFWDKSKKPPVTIQTPGGMHDASHWDYSQLLQPVKRMAKKAATGEEVDLLSVIATTEKIPEKYLAPFMTEVPAAFDIYDEEDVNLVDLLTAAGVTVKAEEGWEKIGREGFDPQGIMVHHTAGPKVGDTACLSTCIQGRPDVPGPLCNIYLSRSGTAHVLAANIANHAGKGAQEVLELVKKGEAVTGNARDHKYADSIGGNTFFYGIEVENSGTEKDPYPPAQIEALSTICAAICSSRKWSAARVIHHRQWTSRKIDMSFRGDLPGLVAQKLDAGAVSFALDEDPTEPMWEPDPDLESPPQAAR